MTLFSIEITPRYQETDQMGVIHHSVYPIYYEQARVAFCDQIGLPFHQIEARGLRQAMLSMTVNYHSPVRFGEKYHLAIQIIKATKVKLVFSYTMRDYQNRLVNSGETLLVWLDRDLKPINLAKHHADVYHRLKEYENTD